MKKTLSHITSPLFLWNLLIQVVISLVAGHLIVTHGRRESFAELLCYPGYFTSVIYSGSIALLLLLCIYAASYRMYVRYGGEDKNKKWIIGQLRWGVVGVLFIEILAATTLFWVKGHWILDTAYFKKLFLPILLFILLANAVYMIFFMLIREPLVQIKYQFLDNDVHPEPGKALLLAIEPAIIFVQDEKTWSVDFYGKRSRWQLSTLDTTVEKLDPEKYFRGNRNWIVHRQIVVRVVMLSGRRLKATCRISQEFDLVVSRRCAVKFKEWIAPDVEVTSSD